MMIDQTAGPMEAEYTPRHMTMQATQDTEEVDLERLRELVDQLPEGTILSIDLEEAADGQYDERH